MSDNKIWKVSGKNESSVKSKATPAKYQQNNSDVIVTSSQEIYDSVTYKNIEERDRYNRLLLGKATRAEVGQDEEANNHTARPPSWTQHAAGLNHSFVINALSASQHEVQCLNAYDRGIEALEQSPTPASGTMYYSKHSSLVKQVFKVSASVDLATQLGTVFYPNIGMFVSRSFTIDAPFSIPLTITNKGKIKDIKVWVEVVQSSASNESYPLASIGLALRSPNVKFEHAHPILNEPTHKEITSAADNYLYVRKGQSFYSNSYLLWEGARLYNYAIIDADSMDSTAYPHDHPSWARDRHIRTIFSDSSKRYNPRHLDKLVANNLTIDNLQDNAPCSGATNAAHAAGNDVPWIKDTRLSGSGGSTTYTAAGSPPAGWLTHPNGGADEGEFVTTGGSWGPNDIRPVYPLLDNIIAMKSPLVSSENYWVYGNEYSDFVGNSNYLSRKGYRQGLHGTEMNGTWELLVACGRSVSYESPNVYFRQFRLEITLEQNEKLRVNRKYKKNSVKPGLTAKHHISGTGAHHITVDTATADYFPTTIYTVVDDQPNTTFGITDNTGALTNFAVFTRITGALADTYAATTRAHARYAFLNNEFGTPYIPLSSGSGLPAESEITAVKTDRTTIPLVADILSPKTNFGRGQTMSSIKTFTRPSRTTRDKMLEITSGSAP